MSTSAIVMMVVSIVIIWGGLLLSLLRLPEE
ncbi:TPA: methionine/alanine import family NSS transporter small subunit [Neisseria lactamica]|uniref:Methionine/alanine import family NSS transporter small subunit n=1 Tax=Neisseria polysaccharea TaxID=489 RepID=A0ABV1JLU8_NEIPO|nr:MULTISPECIES: methionine/alanine import family NSS transporter small subunit [Neisseria]MCL5002528.1 methionine/alanine import family NSS transporter small subunit [Neisseria meningitidis]MCL5911146.1 methionine/alanine import family NSS transporter small subunit [Neisseria meningitidis]